MIAAALKLFSKGLDTICLYYIELTDTISYNPIILIKEKYT